MKQVACSSDYFVTIGGGPSPSSNQISLEKNVQFFQRTLAQIRSDQPAHEIFFADGGSSLRDLQYQEEPPTESEAVKWMSTLLDTESVLGMRYRNHQVAPLAGPARVAYLQQTFKELAATVVAGDRVIIYVSGHGGSAEDDSFFSGGEGDYSSGSSDDENPSYNTSIALWNDEQVTMREFSGWLDKFPRDVVVVMVMVQCYSGGFAHTIYHDGNDQLGLHQNLRVGFFSQRFDRPSAGCTPEVVEENYQDYSTFFFAALSGSDRLGNPTDSADYDQNGSVSLAEAHAYAVITSETIDIPMRTSGEILRRYSKFGSTAGPTEKAEDAPPAESLGAAMATLFGGNKNEKKVDELVYDAKGLLSRKSTLQGLVKLATADQRQVVEKLMEALKIKPESTLSQVRSQFKRAGTTITKRNEAYGLANAEYEVLRSQLLTAMKDEYPEFNEYGYSPIITELTSTRADEFLTFIMQQSQVTALSEVDERMKELADKVQAADVREARLGRLVQTLEEIVLEENLPVVADREVVNRYHQVLQVELGSLGI